MKMSSVLLSCALLAILGSVGAAVPAAGLADRPTEPGKEFVYKQSAGVPQKLEAYFPPGWKPGGSKAPGIILFHGGGWTGGELGQFRYACKYFASRGLVAVTANYRMLPKGASRTLPGGADQVKRVCITDAKSAIRWIKQHADELGVDPQRLIAGGGSAGGHIAVLATTNLGLNDPADPQEFDATVVACLLFNPAFITADGDDPEVDALKQLKATFPPAILFFGTQDKLKAGAAAVVQRLKTLGNTTTELWTAAGQGHGFFNHPPWQDLTLAAADGCLVEHGLLKGSATLAPPPGGARLSKAP